MQSLGKVLQLLLQQEAAGPLLEALTHHWAVGPVGRTCGMSSTIKIYWGLKKERCRMSNELWAKCVQNILIVHLYVMEQYFC